MTTSLPSKDRTAPGQLPERSAVDRLLAHFETMAGQSNHLLSKSFGEFENQGKTYRLPRYILLGPKGGGDTIRLGIFAVINGDEPEGAFALLRFAGRLDQLRGLAKGYALFIYPICNPTGFEDNTRQSRGGKDLSQEFWKDSKMPEVQYLESEIWKHAFDGIVTLHSDKATDGVYGFVNGQVLSSYLLEPALCEAGWFLPRNREAVINGAAAENGIIYRHGDGALRSVPGMARPPFELSIVTPRKAPVDRQVEAFMAALESVLGNYRTLICTAQNI